MENMVLEFKAGNPGAVQYGNFINYYQFHPPDQRVKLLPTNIWKTDHNEFVCLDLGCNAGENNIESTFLQDLTIALHKFLQENVNSCCILGIDIDPVLVQRATEKNKDKALQFQALDFMNLNSTNKLKKYLRNQNVNTFSVIFCFSITMWIHLNHGDEGLKIFLQKICSLGKLVVIEPQPWKCYKSAVKRMRLSNAEFPFFKELKIRQNIEEYIENFLVKDCQMLKMYESSRTDWQRKVLIFRNSSTT